MDEPEVTDFELLREPVRPTIQRAADLVGWLERRRLSKVESGDGARLAIWLGLCLAAVIWVFVWAR